MPDPNPHESHAPERRAEVAQSRDPAAGQAAAGNGPTPDQSGYFQPDVDLGGADAVQKTSYVVGSGTEPAGRAEDINAHPAGGKGPNFLAWGVGAVAVVIAVVYLLGLAA